VKAFVNIALWTLWFLGNISLLLFLVGTAKISARDWNPKLVIVDF
jgi:hypothetical protein